MIVKTLGTGLVWRRNKEPHVNLVGEKDREMKEEVIIFSMKRKSKKNSLEGETITNLTYLDVMRK